jgi:small subunit ribosomal protein S8
MTLNDPLANALSVILHSEMIGRTVCVIKPVSNVIKKVLEIMNEQRFLGSLTEVKDRKGNTLKVNLIGHINKCGVVKPRVAVKRDGYEKFEQQYLPARDVGMLVVSTNKGLMTNIEAKKKRIGGRIIAYCY